MARIFPISAMVISLFVVVWTFVPFPARSDPDGYIRFFGLFPIGAILVVLSILALRRGMSGDGRWWVALGLLFLPLSCLFAIGGNRIAILSCVISLVVVIFGAIWDLHDAT